MCEVDIIMADKRRLTLMELLKRETHELHVGLATLPFFPALAGGTLPQASYVNQLRALATVFGTLEHEIDGVSEPVVVAVRGLGESRFCHLLRDLGCFGGQITPEVVAVKRGADTMASKIRLVSLETPAALLGYAYVLQGTVLGNRVHLPEVQRAFGLSGTSGASFYAGYGERTDGFWAVFGRAVDGAVAGGADAGQVVGSAREAFGFLHDIHAALYPLPAAEDMKFFATSLNPEAGNHAVPADGREIAAAVAAARACRDAYPYFEARYGERGKLFAQSDAAWLAALVELPPPAVVAQAAWLGGVLSSRGMPRVTLEHQIASLHEELVKANPDRKADYDRLLGAAEWLRGERVRQIPEDACDRLAGAFAEATDRELGGSMRGTGLIVVSAVCDEMAGIAGAVASIEPWLTDGDRFPEGWVAAVRETIASARAMAV